MSRTYSTQEVQEQFGYVCEQVESLLKRVSELEDEVMELQRNAND